MKDKFPVNKNTIHTLQHISKFSRRMLKSVYHGTENISNLRPKIWHMVPNILKEIDSFDVFQQEIKKFKLENCPC